MRMTLRPEARAAAEAVLVALLELSLLVLHELALALGLAPRLEQLLLRPALLPEVKVFHLRLRILHHQIRLQNCHRPYVKFKTNRNENVNFMSDIMKFVSSANS